MKKITALVCFMFVIVSGVAFATVFVPGYDDVKHLDDVVMPEVLLADSSDGRFDKLYLHQDRKDPGLYLHN